MCKDDDDDDDGEVTQKDMTLIVSCKKLIYD